MKIKIVNHVQDTFPGNEKELNMPLSIASRLTVLYLNKTIKIFVLRFDLKLFKFQLDFLPEYFNNFKNKYF
jgi:hypothetical protein